MIRPTRLAACAPLLSLNACATATPEPAVPEQARLGGQALPSPCEFHRNAEGTPHIEQQGAVPILLVQHSPPEAPPGQGWVTRLQAVRLLQGTLPASAPMTSANCPRGPWDPTRFTGPFDG